MWLHNRGISISVCLHACYINLPDWLASHMHTHTQSLPLCTTQKTHNQRIDTIALLPGDIDVPSLCVRRVTLRIVCWVGRCSSRKVCTVGTNACYPKPLMPFQVQRRGPACETAWQVSVWQGSQWNFFVNYERSKNPLLPFFSRLCVDCRVALFVSTLSNGFGCKLCTIARNPIPPVIFTFAPFSCSTLGTTGMCPRRPRSRLRAPTRWWCAWAGTHTRAHHFKCGMPTSVTHRRSSCLHHFWAKTQDNRWWHCSNSCSNDTNHELAAITIAKQFFWAVSSRAFQRLNWTIVHQFYEHLRFLRS